MAEMDNSRAAPARPWTPTERPGDASYTSSVVYHGDHQIDDSEVSSDEEPQILRPQIVQPGGKEVEADVDRPKPLRFSASQAYLRDTASSPPSSQAEFSSYQPYRSSEPLKPRNDDRLPAGNPYRMSAALKSQNADNLFTVKPERPQSTRLDSGDPAPIPKVEPKPEPPEVEEIEGLSSVTGTSTRPIKILLINPNSTKSTTDRCLESIKDTLPPRVTVYGFTPTRPAPTAIESQTDAIMSTAACTKSVLPIASKFDALLVACYSHHPLITALREQLMQPVIGIMEASIYASRMCGTKFGIVTIGVRPMYLLDASVKNAYGLGQFSVGTESSRMGVLELESKPVEEVNQRLSHAAKRLQARGADCICLGCAGMTDMKLACQDAVGMHDRVAMVVDGVAIGIHFLIGLVRENLGTAKGGGGFNTISGHKSLKS